MGVFNRHLLETCGLPIAGVKMRIGGSIKKTRLLSCHSAFVSLIVCWTIAFGVLHADDSCASLAQAPDAIVTIRSTEPEVYIFKRIKRAAESEGMNCHVYKYYLLCQFRNAVRNAIIVMDEDVWIGAEMSYSDKNSTQAKEREAILRRVMEKFAQSVRGSSGVSEVMWCAWPAGFSPKHDRCDGDDLLAK
jgi:hypothetical protein